MIEAGSDIYFNCSLFPTLTHTISVRLSLLLSHTHTHTHTHQVSLSLTCQRRCISSHCAVACFAANTRAQSGAYGERFTLTSTSCVSIKALAVPRGGTSPHLNAANGAGSPPAQCHAGPIHARALQSSACATT